MIQYHEELSLVMVLKEKSLDKLHLIINLWKRNNEDTYFKRS